MLGFCARPDPSQDERFTCISTSARILYCTLGTTTANTRATRKSTKRSNGRINTCCDAPGRSVEQLIDDGAFLKLYDLQFGRLGALQRAGLTKRIGYINEDMDICDVGWCAYMLWPNGSSNPVHQVGQNERDDDTEKRPTGRFMENVNRQYQGHVKDEG
jgi:hypothetical protein